MALVVLPEGVPASVIELSDDDVSCQIVPVVFVPK
jgi:hypothetical protein